MVPGPALREAIERAYEAFAAYPRPRAMEASPLRDPAKILRSLTRVPLRDVLGEDIGPYAGWALTTVGRVDDYRHFLPRILEVAVEGGSWLGTEPAVIASRLGMGEWRSWPKREQAAVAGGFAQALDQACRSHPHKADASDWLCGLAPLGEEVGPHLDAWAKRRDADALVQLAQFVQFCPDLTGSGPDTLAFWEEVAMAPRLQIAAWIASPAVAEAILYAAGEVEGDDSWNVEGALETLAARRVH